MITSLLLVALLSSPSSTALVIDNNLNNTLNHATFDYVIVGCGIAGLVVANRLTEDRASTVLCLEAGDLDNDEDLIRIPYYIGLQPPLFYEWGHESVPQTQLDGKTRSVPMGKGVGGGSLINGMLANRGAQVDFDIWGQLNDANWSWADLLPYFRKSESFTPQDYARDHITDKNQVDSFNVTTHGFNGPLQVSYPAYLWPQTGLWFEALEDLGVAKCLDPNDGTNGGGYFIPLTVDPNGQTRSDARRSYYDPAALRPNLHVAVHAQATRVLFDGVDNSRPTQPAPYNNNSASGWHNTGLQQHSNASKTGLLRARGVLFASSPSAPIHTVHARREVILASGAIHSSRLLELSGIGSASLLNSHSIPILHELPGVGNNLQDHAMIHLNYSYQNTSIQSVATFVTNTSFLAASKNEYLNTRTGPWTARPSTAVGFPSLAQVTNTTYTASLIALASLDNASSYLPLSMRSSPTHLSGYTALLPSILRALNTSTVPSHEILNSNAGTLDLSLMRPLSRGTTHITSASPWASIAIDPNWLSHPLDFAIMLRAMEFNQRLLTTPALAQLQPSWDTVPYGASEDVLSDILKRGVGTEYHYSGTCAMLPLSMGGVVDPDLVVYGTSNLRVVDSSIFPVIPGAHLQAVVYAVAEKAADIIKGGDQGKRAEQLKGVLDHEVPKGEWWKWFWDEVGVDDGKESGKGKRSLSWGRHRHGRRRL